MALDNLDKAYSPAEVERRWYRFWEDNKLFHADENKDGDHFSIVIPPPNVTGDLHMGHAFNNTMQDILCRYARMMGKAVLWMPGMDHAGIATQNVVERQLAEEGLPATTWAAKNSLSGSGNGAGKRAARSQPAQTPGRLLRLGPRALHHG
jgi:valyl-tRNA synthetase